ncbi:hypothetical protein AB0J86_20950 [Micromonospora sp. NPDC049559]|uniref:hypothetical protein n=1 Tax=Micromonospora sp. NPDC049559 TaxID=3155923 RepID=UPI0034463644
MTATPHAQPPDFPSTEDIDDAHDIVYGHRPRQVIRWYCACGDAYPCWELRFARLVLEAAGR